MPGYIHRRRLPPAPISTGQIASTQRCQKPFGQLTIGLLEGLGHRRNHLGTSQNIPLDTIPGTYPMPSPSMAGTPSMRSSTTAHIHQANLALFAIRVVG
jgi:hypothetical protein